jgi:hypothetical protein
VSVPPAVDSADGACDLGFVGASRSGPAGRPIPVRQGGESAGPAGALDPCQCRRLSMMLWCPRSDPASPAARFMASKLR